MPSIRINKVPWHSVSFHSIRLLSFTFSLTSLHTYTLSWIIEFCRLKDSSSRERRNVSSLSDLGHVSWLLDIMWGTEEYIVTLKNETTISLLNELNEVLILHTGDWNHNHREKKELGSFCCLAKAKLSIDYFRCAKLLFFVSKISTTCFWPRHVQGERKQLCTLCGQFITRSCLQIPGLKLSTKYI